jgi:type I restriction enzyme, R subunit
MAKPTSEQAFEDAIEHHLLSHGYERGSPQDYDPELGLDTAQLFTFIGATQASEWERLVELHGGDRNTAQQRFCQRLTSQIDKHGTIAVLRHGVTDLGVDIRLAYFRPAHSLNPESQALYDANRLSVTRQLRYAGDAKSLDLTLFCNGLPVATAELKNKLTGQDVNHAIAQYRKDRDPRNVLFSRRALVHFAVDPDLVMMTTNLEGPSTTFLPFNRGSHPDSKGCGAGNPSNPAGHATAYLWESVWGRDAWLDILARFVHLTQEEPGAKAKARRSGNLIFPRYHQWDAVRRLEAHARQNGSGTHYLIEHSAGSGKSNTIAWLAHRLSSLHDQNDSKIFEKIVVVTDRRILDRQLQDTVYQFEHAHGLVAKIEESSQQLADALESTEAQIIITTLQKFPFLVDKLGDLPDRNYAVLIDEAHSSQSGEAAAEMRRVLGSTEDEEPPDLQDYVDALVERTAKARGRQPNLSLFAFTATPKAKTLEIFGTPIEGEGVKGPFHLYPMRQAIEEGFILDVVSNYATYTSYYRVASATPEDPEVDPSRATAAIARFAQLHPDHVAQKAEIVVEHVRRVTQHKIEGRAKAMVVCRSRLSAVRWRLAIDKYLREQGVGGIKCLVAFSGTVKDNGIEHTESRMNGFPERQTAEQFASNDEHRILVVAEKFQTGFDQPLLHTMFVDKKLAGVHAVQTLSRLNRIRRGKEDTFVLDFTNTADEIEHAFKPYYEVTYAAPTDPNTLFDARNELEQFGVIRTPEVEAYARDYFAASPADRSAHARLHIHLEPARDRFGDLDSDDQDSFRKALKRFVSMYGFVAQIMPLHDTPLEKRYAYCRALQRYLPRREQGVLDLGDLELTHLRLKKTGKHQIELGGEVAPVEAFTGEGDGQGVLPGMEPLSVVIERINEAHGSDLGEGDKLHIESVAADMIDNPEVQLFAAANTKDNFALEFDKRMQDAFVDRMGEDERLTRKFLDDASFRSSIRDFMLDIVYERARVSSQKTCPIGDLLARDEDQFLELKSTLMWDLKKNERSKVVQSAVIKTVAAFLNSRHGGTLLIGVRDDKSIEGLGHDYTTLHKEGKDDRDTFLLHLTQVLDTSLGAAATALLSAAILSVDGHDICRLHAEPSPYPVDAEITTVDAKGQHSKRSAFFIRQLNRTREIAEEAEIQRYKAQRWSQ